MSLLRRLPAALAVLAALAWPAHATWSIVVVDTRTGEVAVGTATCLTGLNIQHNVPVILVGLGAGAAQANIDLGALNRMRMVDDLKMGWSPQMTLDDLIAHGIGNPNGRQYGIAAFTGPPVTFTGSSTFEASSGVAGIAGDLQYAIQGNILVGDEVVLGAEAALIATPGDLGQKLMAAMQAARALGGDGRCSCSPVFSEVTSCGVPPPGTWKSSHVACMIVARHGDTDLPCNNNQGCARGDYYLNFNVIGQASDPDPVFTLQAEFDAWRASLAGVADHLRSRVSAGAAALPADGVTRATVRVELADLNGLPLTAGGAQLSIQPESASTATTIGAVTDHGDGTYSFDVVAGTVPSDDTWRIIVHQGPHDVTLYPFLDMRVDPPAPLHAGFDQVSAGAGGDLPFVIRVPSAPGAPYLLLASASGTMPGIPIGGLTLPLNPDPVLLASLAEAGTALLPGSTGHLDATGRAEAAFVPPPGLLTSFVGLRFDWAALYAAPTLQVTNVVGVEVAP